MTQHRKDVFVRLTGEQLEALQRIVDYRPGALDLGEVRFALADPSNIIRCEPKLEWTE